MMRGIIATMLGLTLVAMGAIAQEGQTGKPMLLVESRVDYDRDYINGESQLETSGFKCQMVDVKLQGSIGDKFSYCYRQRLNGLNKNFSFFDSVDWLYLTYKPTENTSLSVGKWVILVAGWEFDPAPIDCFQLSEFTMHFPCYEWGVWGSINTRNKKDQFIAQFCRSPFERLYKARTGGNAEMYSYHLVWNGNHGLWHTNWSVNLMERDPHKYLGNISLGNRFVFDDHWTLELDLLNRYASGQKLLFDDITLIGNLKYRMNDQFEAFVRGSYDLNKSGTNKDELLANGTDIATVGAGVFFYPLKNEKVRLHARYQYSFGENTTNDPVAVDNRSYVNVGVTWKVRVM